MQHPCDLNPIQKKRSKVCWGAIIIVETPAAEVLLKMFCIIIIMRLCAFKQCSIVLTAFRKQPQIFLQGAEWEEWWFAASTLFFYSNLLHKQLFTVKVKDISSLPLVNGNKFVLFSLVTAAQPQQSIRCPCVFFPL